MKKLLFLFTTLLLIIAIISCNKETPFTDLSQTEQALPYTLDEIRNIPITYPNNPSLEAFVSEHPHFYTRLLASEEEVITTYIDRYNEELTKLYEKAGNNTHRSPQLFLQNIDGKPALDFNSSSHARSVTNYVQITLTNPNPRVSSNTLWYKVGGSWIARSHGNSSNSKDLILSGTDACPGNSGYTEMAFHIVLQTTNGGYPKYDLDAKYWIGSSVVKTMSATNLHTGVFYAINIRPNGWTGPKYATAMLTSDGCFTGYTNPY